MMKTSKPNWMMPVTHFHYLEGLVLDDDEIDMNDEPEGQTQPEQDYYTEDPMMLTWALSY